VLGTLAGLDGVPPRAADAAVLLHRAPLAVLILTYPGRRMRGTLMRGLIVVALLTPLAPGGAGPYATAAVAALVALTVSIRAARTAAALRPPVLAAAVTGVAVAIAAIPGAANVGNPDMLLAGYDTVQLGTAIALLAPVAGGRWKDAAASDLVVELETAPANAPLTARLAEVLHDSALQLLLRLPDGSWVDEAGNEVPAPAAQVRQRSITRQVLDDGTEVALLHDPAAIPDQAVAETAVSVAATTIDAARRAHDVQTRIRELRRLRRGLLDAVDEEQRQLQVELRSGPLREIDELNHLLDDLPDEHAAALRRELAIVRRELLEIAHGLHPQALLERGLAPEVSDAASRSPVPVTLTTTLGESPLPPAVALTAYYVASEALTNIAKHSHAQHARIEMSLNTGSLSILITDDGVGGADPDGDGLRGLRDRVHAVDGTLRVTSTQGAGTVVEAHLPLTEPPGGVFT
jgi:signal transduction histidine kinase